MTNATFHEEFCVGHDEAFLAGVLPGRSLRFRLAHATRRLAGEISIWFHSTHGLLTPALLVECGFTGDLGTVGDV
jgi:hypothetical protein